MSIFMNNRCGFGWSTTKRQSKSCVVASWWRLGKRKQGVHTSAKVAAHLYTVFAINTSNDIVKTHPPCFCSSSAILLQTCAACCWLWGIVVNCVHLTFWFAIHYHPACSCPQPTEDHACNSPSHWILTGWPLNGQLQQSSNPGATTVSHIPEDFTPASGAPM